MIVFRTPGLVDIDALTTFGVSVKESKNPIGQFGTGFKYAVATILRLGGSITLYRGDKQRFDFQKTSKKIRGEKFDVVSMAETLVGGEVPQMAELGFTTQLGGHWLPWMAYRELLCNTIDEGGTAERALTYELSPKQTTIVVRGANFEQEHDDQRNNFLFGETSKPAWSAYNLEVWNRSAPFIYYKRVRAYDDPQKLPFVMTYNFTHGCVLTEDRTIKNHPFSTIAEWLVNCDDEEILSRVLLCSPQWAEHQIPWAWASTPGDAFVNVVRKNIRNPMLNSTARTLVQRCKLSLFVDEVELNSVDRSKLERALWFCKQIGYDVRQPIVVAASLADAGVLGYADTRENKIVLSQEVFRRGTKEVAQTLLEEHIHLQFGLQDESRQMQEHLFQLATTLGERVIGEAL